MDVSWANSSGAHRTPNVKEERGRGEGGERGGKLKAISSALFDLPLFSSPFCVGAVLEFQSLFFVLFFKGESGVSNFHACKSAFIDCPLFLLFFSFLPFSGMNAIIPPPPQKKVLTAGRSRPQIWKRKKRRGKTTGKGEGENRRQKKSHCDRE